MADNVTITQGSGTTIATDDIGGVMFQRVKVSLGADGSAVDAVAGAGAVGTGVQRVTLASDDPAVTSLAILDDWDESDRAKVNIIAGQAGVAAGAGAVDALTQRITHASDDPTTTALQIIDDWDESDRAKVNPIVGQAGVAGGAGAVGATTQRVTLASDDPLVAIFKNEDAASGDTDKGMPILAVRKAAAANTSNTDGDYEMLQMLGGRVYVRGEPRMFSVTASAMTRPANTTAYAANDAVSNNATAGSVTAISFTLSDTNDDPISIERCRLVSTDTGIAGKTFRVWLFNSDPTASSGVGGGDNAAWSQKQAGFIGTVSNASTTGSNSTFRTFSDGCGGVLTPDEGTRIITTPTSGAKTVFALIQTLEAFTPSANSTTFTLTLEGIQGRA